MLMILVLAAAILIYYWIIKPYNYWKEKGVIQGRPWYLFGDIWGPLLKMMNAGETVDYLYKRFPGRRYHGVYQMTKPVLLLKDIDLIKQITVKDFDHFTDHKTFISAEGDPLWGKNLFTLKGKMWHDMRSTLSPSFTSSKMKIMFNLMTEVSENFMTHFINRKETLQTLEMKDIFTRFTNDVIATCAFGLRVDSISHADNEFYLMGNKITNFDTLLMKTKLMGFLLIPSLFKFFKISLLSKQSSNYFVELITHTIRTREENGIVRPDMINILMELRKGITKDKNSNISTVDTGFATAQESTDIQKSGMVQELTDIDIAAQALIFFVAGFDTVSRLMCFTSHELAVNQEVQTRLREEIQQTNNACGGKLTYEALLGMKYMDMVISEALRKWPGTILVDRVCVKPYTIEPANEDEKPLHLEKGAVLWVPTYGIHHDPDIYPDPEKFDPERFNNENKDNINPSTYIPFGIGPRNCIGSRFALLETKILFFYLLSHFELVPVEKTSVPLKLIKHPFILTAEGGFWLGLKRLNK